jgi:hypothetical protein
MTGPLPEAEEWDSPSCTVCMSAVFPPTDDLRGQVLSPRGKWHSAESDRTLCGKDATPDGWWWPC